MEYINVTMENLEKEHICCAISNNRDVQVPLLQAVLLHRFPRWKAVFCALLCLFGVGLLTTGSGLKFGTGEMFCMLAAFLYACAIVITDRLTHGSINSLTAGIVQVGTIGILSLTASLLCENPRVPAGMLEWTGIIMLAFVCTGFGFTLQPVAQSGTTAERAGLFCALNPMVAAILGSVFLQEVFTAQSAIGGGMILAGILLSELPLPNTKGRLLCLRCRLRAHRKYRRAARLVHRFFR